MYTLDFLATISNCDAQGRLKLCSALQMMQDCSEKWLDSEPCLKQFFKDHNVAQLLAFRQVEVLRAPVCWEQLKVVSSVYSMKPKFGFRNTFVYGADGLPCYRTWSMGAFVDMSTGKLSPIDAPTLASLNLEEQREMNYGERRIHVPAEGGAEAEPFRVMRSYIDYNLHVNNANYVRMGLELLPDDFEVHGLKVEYRVAAKRGDTLAPTVFNCGDRWVVVLSLNGAISAVMEFT